MTVVPLASYHLEGNFCRFSWGFKSSVDIAPRLEHDFIVVEYEGPGALGSLQDIVGMSLKCSAHADCLEGLNLSAFVALRSLAYEISMTAPISFPLCLVLEVSP